MFKVINSIVQFSARFVALLVGIVLGAISAIVWKINEAIMLLFALSIWSLGRVARFTNMLFGWMTWLPGQIALHALLFAFDISKVEHKEQMDIVQKQLDEANTLQSFKALRAAEALKEKMDAETEETK